MNNFLCDICNGNLKYKDLFKGTFNSNIIIIEYFCCICNIPSRNIIYKNTMTLEIANQLIFNIINSNTEIRDIYIKHWLISSLPEMPLETKLLIKLL